MCRAASRVPDRVITATSLCGCTSTGESRDGDQVVRNDAEPDPSRRAVHTSITTALQSMASLEHTDPALASDAPALAAAKPALALERAPGRRFGSGTRQDHASDAAGHGGAIRLETGATRQHSDGQ